MTRFSAVDFDSVAPLMPNNRVAGRVSARGEHFEFEPNLEGVVHSDGPIATRRPNRAELGQPAFVDLTGVKIGRLTVQGIAADVATGNGQNWAVRCVCGSYETRKAKYIKSALVGNVVDSTGIPMCMWCGKTNKLRMGMHDPAKAAAAARVIQECAR
ncbi:hypothetical protein DXT89_14130 [Agrobacterium vitis]|uniref:Uncharacterized protein n=1 Tax=Agrobacterium vitis TaxID=373 RepID=A0A7J4X4L3_AGRVI|nr:hypothetical protein [Agrobacterium vitis]KAA3527067.1 hypothetical protein DXT89_14130 [Agrobacterium vitis]